MSEMKAPIQICPFCGSARTRTIRGQGICFACEALYDPSAARTEPAGGPAPGPGTIFLSYARPEAEMGHRIRKALEKRGFTVWTAAEKLQPGSDWRQTIAEGLATSQGVVACLSRHAVRDPGACLEELSLAMGIQGGRLQTILLEPEDRVEPPASLNTTQWLDMSDWNERMDEGDRAFQAWFQEKMDRLVRVLEDPDPRDLPGGLSELKKRLHVSCDDGPARDLLGQSFVGRRWLEERLNAWLDDPNGPQLGLLSGEPGVGKSAFAAHLLHFNRRVAAGLFCEADSPFLADSRTLVMNLAYRLACRLPAYRQALLFLTEVEERLPEMSEDELFTCLLLFPLTRILTDIPRETLCVVIDGLDECGKKDRDRILASLSVWANRLPSWLRILVTSREEASIQKRLQGAFRLPLRSEGEENRGDIEAYFAAALGARFGVDPAWPAAWSALVKRSGGSFLYAHTVAESILSGNLPLDDPSAFPENLAQAFHNRFAWSFPDREEYGAVWRPALEMLLASPEPLPRTELERALGWDEERQNVFLSRMTGLLRRERNDFGEETLAFRHLSLMEWLQGNPDQEPYGASAAEGLRRMAEAFWKLSAPDARNLSAYEALHLVDFLERSGKSKAAWAAVLDPNLTERVLRWGNFCLEREKPDGAERCHALALELCERMIRERGDDNDRALLAVLYDRTGALRLLQGRPEEALDFNRKAMLIRENLTQVSDTAHNRLALSASCVHLGDILLLRGIRSQALRCYRRALSIREKLLRAAPEPDGRLSFLVSVCLRKLAEVLYGQDRFPEALEYLRGAVTLAREAADAEAAPEHLEHLSGCLDLLGSLYQETDRPDDALELYRQNRTLTEQMLKEDPTPTHLRFVSSTYGRIADLLRDQNRIPEALELYRKALDLEERLARDIPLPEYLRDLSVSCETAADALEEAGESDRALALYHRSAAIRENLTRDLPILPHQTGLCVTWERIAEILETQDRSEEALAYYRKAAAIRKELVRLEPTADRLDALGICQERIGDCLKNLGRLDEALASYRDSEKVTERLARIFPDPQHRKSLAMCRLNVGETLDLKGNGKEALELFQDARAICERLVKEDPIPDFRQALSVCCEKISDILIRQGKVKEALEYCRTSMNLDAGLVRETPSPEYRQGLSSSCTRVADIITGLGQYEEALRLFRQALDIDEQLAREQPTQEYLRNLGISCCRTADALTEVGRQDEAVELYRKAKRLADQLLRDIPSLQHKLDAAIATDRVAELLYLQGNYEEALSLFQESMAMRQQAAQELSTSEQKSGLSISFENIARVLDAMGSYEEALDLYQASYSILSQLVREDPAPEIWRSMAVNCVHMAENLEMQGRDDEALSRYEAARTVLLRLTRAVPIPEYLQNLSGICSNLAGFLEERGELERAIPLYEQSRDILESLARENPLPEYQEELERLRGILEDLQG